MGRGEASTPSPPEEWFGEGLSPRFLYSLVYKWLVLVHSETNFYTCLLYTSDAADE